MQQIYYRLRRQIIKPRVVDEFSGILPVRPGRWIHKILHKERVDTKLRASFLNQTRTLLLPHDWNAAGVSELWAYNLHYFDDLLAENAQIKNHFHLELLNNWIDHNPPGFGIGWSAYPLSLRIVNILKAWLGGLELDEKVFGSVFMQASFLSQGLEKHLLGNHYFANLKALLFAGVIFDNPSWTQMAEQQLRLEIQEQILEDGVHFELSPMYHNLMLLDMLDLANLAKSYPTQISLELFEHTQEMLNVMSVLAHNDDGVSFFNDSANGISPAKDQIELYAASLGFEIRRFDSQASQLVELPSSGYIVASANGSKLVFDAANVGPDYIPGHAHADTLAFELSIGDERVFVNTGISEYGLSAKRLSERGTAAHNTVEVDSSDSSQVWGGFRVAKRAQIVERAAEIDCDTALLSASHDGYRRINGGPIHRRTLLFRSNTLEVIDELQGSFKTAVVRFYFHPNLEVTVSDGCLKASSSHFDMEADLSGLVTRLVKSTWHPSFGISMDNECLECDFLSNIHSIKFLWSRK